MSVMHILIGFVEFLIIAKCFFVGLNLDWNSPFYLDAVFWQVFV